MNACSLAAAAKKPGIYRIEQALKPAEDGGNCVRHYRLPEIQRIQRDTLLTALANTLEFPEYFGKNWDAAFDCLTDRDWAADTVVILEMPLLPGAYIDEPAFHTLLDLMQDAVYFWFDNKVILYFLIQSQAHAMLNTIEILK